jgi:hypothetical protein
MCPHRGTVTSAASAPAAWRASTVHDRLLIRDVLVGVAVEEQGRRNRARCVPNRTVGVERVAVGDRIEAADLLRPGALLRQ